MRGPFALLAMPSVIVRRFWVHHGTRNFFIIFVDAIFTTLLEPLFTNALDVIGAKLMKSCVWRARHAD
jgi:hypothetical protein